MLHLKVEIPLDNLKKVPISPLPSLAAENYILLSEYCGSVIRLSGIFHFRSKRCLSKVMHRSRLDPFLTSKRLLCVDRSLHTEAWTRELFSPL